MAALDRTRRLIELQGYRGLTDRSIVELDPWLRVAPAFCAGWALMATIRGSASVFAVLAGIGALGALLPVHPFDLPYNFVVRHWTGTVPIPHSAFPRRFACGVATVWLSAAALAFHTAATVVGVVLGLAFTATAAVPVLTGVCVPSLILSLLSERQRPVSVLPDER